MQPTRKTDLQKLIITKEIEVLRIRTNRQRVRGRGRRRVHRDAVEFGEELFEAVEEGPVGEQAYALGRVHDAGRVGCVRVVQRVELGGGARRGRGVSAR